MNRLWANVESQPRLSMDACVAKSSASGELMDLNCGLAIEELCSSLQLLIDIAVMTVRVINKCIVSYILVSFIVDNSKVKTFF